MKRTTTSGDGRDAGVQLLVAEYQAVRNEILESFKLTQAIIQWSLAIYGVGFGAGFVALTEATKTSNPFLQWMVAVMFGLLLPGLMWAASFHWLGEITRMERAGSYVRGLEFQFRSAEFSIGSGSVPRPLNWERHLSENKRWLPYFAVAALFGGTFLVALGVSVSWMMYAWGLDYWPIIGGVATFLIYVVTAAWIGVRIKNLGRQRYDFERESLVSYG